MDETFDERSDELVPRYLETLVQRLDEDLNQIENSQFALGTVDAEDKVKRRVMPIDQSIIVASDQCSSFEKIAHVIVAFRNQLIRFSDDLLLKFFGIMFEEFHQSRFRRIVKN